MQGIVSVTKSERKWDVRTSVFSVYETKSVHHCRRKIKNERFYLMSQTLKHFWPLRRVEIFRVGCRKTKISDTVKTINLVNPGSILLKDYRSGINKSILASMPSRQELSGVDNAAASISADFSDTDAISSVKVGNSSADRPSSVE